MNSPKSFDSRTRLSQKLSDSHSRVSRKLSTEPTSQSPPPVDDSSHCSVDPSSDQQPAGKQKPQVVRKKERSKLRTAFLEKDELNHAINVSARDRESMSVDLTNLVSHEPRISCPIISSDHQIMVKLADRSEVLIPSDRTKEVETPHRQERMDTRLYSLSMRDESGSRFVLNNKIRSEKSLPELNVMSLQEGSRIYVRSSASNSQIQSTSNSRHVAQFTESGTPVSYSVNHEPPWVRLHRNTNDGSRKNKY